MRRFFPLRGVAAPLQPTPKRLRAVVVTCAAVTVTLLSWGIAAYAIAAGADGLVREQTNAWTPIVVGPIIVVYGCLAIGLIRGRWRVWRWMPATVLVAAVSALIVQAAIDEAGRAYEPEQIWIALFWAAPIAAVVVLATEPLRERSARAA